MLIGHKNWKICLKVCKKWKRNCFAGNLIVYNHVFPKHTNQTWQDWVDAPSLQIFSCTHVYLFVFWQCRRADVWEEKTFWFSKTDRRWFWFYFSSSANLLLLTKSNLSLSPMWSGDQRGKKFARLWTISCPNGQHWCRSKASWCFFSENTLSLFLSGMPFRWRKLYSIFTKEYILIMKTYVDLCILFF